MSRIVSINPANGAEVKSYSPHTLEGIKTKIDRCNKAWLEYRESAFSQRAAVLKNAAKILLRDRKDLAALMAAEMGKPLRDGIAEVEKCAAVCTFYAENGAAFLADEKVETDLGKSYISYQPIGVVLAVMPWNFPFWQVFRFAAPAVLAGNAAILKHASNVSGCGLAIEEIFKEAGLPNHVFQTILLSSKLIRHVIENPLIKAVTLTGSTEAGMEVAKQAASLIKKTVLELGGSDPYIILPDADIEQAATICAQSRLINNGQSCIAAKRFIVVKDVQSKFIDAFCAAMSNYSTGDPMSEQTDLGPMARIDLRDQLHRQVKANIAKGAKVILGGAKSLGSSSHAFYSPTILIGVKKGMLAYKDELFGPVASIITARNTEHAITIANDTNFGLGAAVFTSDKKLGEKIAREKLQAGTCVVNSFVRSDPRLPFGGINQSGYGRELGMVGIREFVNIKTVIVK